MALDCHKLTNELPTESEKEACKLSAKIMQGDIGTVFNITVLDSACLPVDLTGTVVTFYFETPNYTIMQRTGTIAPDGIVTYTTVAGDLDVAGDWKFEVRVVGAGSWTSDTHSFIVHPRIGGI